MCVLLLSHLNRMLNLCTPLTSPQQNVKCVYSSYLILNRMFKCVYSSYLTSTKMLNVCIPSYLTSTEC